MSFASIFAASLGVLALALAAPAGNKVTSVPGFTGTIPFDQYAGYLPVSDGTKQLFYWFVQSQNNPSKDPVVLWLNGGPGCSSFDGFIYEHGPFFFEDGPTGANQKLSLNPTSWNHVANMLYVDSPCGVGLSYQNNSKIYTSNDKVTARDSHSFLLNFFAAYPEFKKNDFYISGESYAGVYVPTLAEQVVLGNAQDPSTSINLKGILVGNGVTDQVFDGNALMPFVYGHGLIDIDLWLNIDRTCKGNYWNASGECSKYVNQANNLIADLNIYNTYDDCYHGGREYSDEERNKMVESFNNVWYRIEARKRDAVEDVPCIDSSRATAWINQDSVRTAIHAIPVSQKAWEICSNSLIYSRTYDSVIPQHQYLLKNNVKILIYSGDTDLCVPYTGSEAWTRSLNLPVANEWRPWKVNQQVAGYVRDYSQLVFATIKGSGHTVPQYKPAQAFYMFSKFITGSPF